MRSIWILWAAIVALAAATAWLAVLLTMPATDVGSRPDAPTPIMEPAQAGIPELPVGSLTVATVPADSQTAVDRLPGLQAPTIVPLPRQAGAPTVAPTASAGVNPPRATVTAAAAPANAPTATPNDAPSASASRGASGPLTLQLSASPTNPVSETAEVTVSIALARNGAGLEGGSCMGSVYFRTTTARLPDNGVQTGPSGRASFVINARGATYDRYVPVDVTCATRYGDVTARTGFTPIKAR